MALRTYEQFKEDLEANKGEFISFMLGYLNYETQIFSSISGKISSVKKSKIKFCGGSSIIYKKDKEQNLLSLELGPNTFDLSVLDDYNPEITRHSRELLLEEAIERIPNSRHLGQWIRILEEPEQIGKVYYVSLDELVLKPYIFNRALIVNGDAVEVAELSKSKKSIATRENNRFPIEQLAKSCVDDIVRASCIGAGVDLKKNH